MQNTAFWWKISIFADVTKIAFFEFPLCVDDVIKICDDVIICKSCDLPILIPDTLKNVPTKFQDYTIRRTRFIAIFWPRAKKPQKQKKPAWDRVK